MHLVREGVPEVLEILMAVGPHQFQGPSVQEESLPGIETERTDAESVPLRIHDFSAGVQQAGHDGIHLRRIHVPQAGIADMESGRYRQVRTRGILAQAFADRSDLLPVRRSLFPKMNK